MMDLSNLTLQKDQLKIESESLVVKVPKKVAPLQEVIKELNLVQVTLVKLDSKVVKCHFKDVYQNLVSRIQIEKSIEV